ncbi:MAG: UPF0147 family protein [Candidatus Nezhaarchaeota archaeon]|nr:UPF0147 family protein [Candidatus Nezhaarchaeota archaeon]MCX8142254.1 UPF0147 family protein [Candidatus Nezhaarchaeota archaeon]MDW8050773.1 UPF0147 family protein [Nitrososphaerota archaeon]
MSVEGESEQEQKISQAIMILQRVADDLGVPRNIRRACSESIKVLKTRKFTPGVRASNAISILDECSQDPNMPLFARTAIWQAVSILEQVKD